MTTEPPFQPPQQPGQRPPPGPGEGKRRRFSLGGGYSLLGLLFGLLLGLGLPPAIFGFLIAILGSTGLPDGIAIVIPIIVAIAVTVGVFIFLAKQLNRSDGSQAAVRTALVVSGYTSLGIWVVLSLLVGACIALLAGAYG